MGLKKLICMIKISYFFKSIIVFYLYILYKMFVPTWAIRLTIIMMGVWGCGAQLFSLPIP